MGGGMFLDLVCLCSAHLLGSCLLVDRQLATLG